MQNAAFGLLLLATMASGQMYSPYYADLTWEPPRTLSIWSNLTVETQTGTFIGMLNDTYPNVRQFLRIPFAQVSTLSTWKSFKHNLLTWYWLLRRLLAISVGCLLRSPIIRQESMTRRDLDRVNHPKLQASVGIIS